MITSVTDDYHVSPFNCTQICWCMMKKCSDVLSKVFGDLRSSLEIFRNLLNFSEIIWKHSCCIQRNLENLWKIFRKWPELVFGKSPKTSLSGSNCVYDKQNDMCSLIERQRCLTYLVQLYIPLVCYTHSWDTWLNSQSDMPYICVFMYYPPKVLSNITQGLNPDHLNQSSIQKFH